MDEIPSVTAHAVDRYIERVKPCATSAQAKGEILALCRAAGEPVVEPPAWKLDSLEGGLHLEVTEGVAFIFQGGRLTTVVTRGGESAEHRRERRKKARREREQAAIQRRNLKHNDRRRKRVREDDWRKEI